MGNKKKGKTTMYAFERHMPRPSARLLVILALLVLGLPGASFRVTASHARPLPVTSRPAATTAPKTPRAAATLPLTSCTLGGTTRTCDLYATTGTLSLPGLSAPLPIDGYAATSTGPAGYPGPTLIVKQGETVTINLHNNLADATSLSIPAMPLVPDTAGVAPGASKTYTFTAAQPGTFIYQAGLTTNGMRQVAMGLFGALIVRPSTNPTSAYGDTASAFDDEALVLLSEIDPNLNNNPTGFTMASYSPRYWLINGKVYPSTDPIPSAPGHRILLRYVNAGLREYSMGLLGMHQTVLANDGLPLTNSYQVVAETIPPGATMDTISTIPTSAVNGAQFALYSAARHLDNAGQLSSPLGQIAFGGMLTFITMPGTASTGGPVTSNASASPNPTAPSGSVALSASATSSVTVTGAEYFVDVQGANGAGTSMTVTAGSPAGLAGTLAVATLPSGTHTVYIHAQDSNGAWGAFTFVALVVDGTGPTTSGATLSPNPTNGTVDVALQATADDSATGNANIQAAEYFVDAAGVNGSGHALAVTPTLPPVNPIASVAGTIPAATVNALSEGNHTVYVHSQDTVGNWGPMAQVTLVVDKTAPVASNLAALPNPNNGTLTYDINGTFVRVFGTFNDPVSNGIQSNIRAGEAFLDVIRPNGTGTPLIPATGAFTGSSVTAYFDIQLPGVKALSQGPHLIYLHAQDAAGNWGPLTTFATLIIDKTGPAISGLSVAPNPTLNATTVTVAATATDPPNGTAPASNIVAAEWFVGADPGVGNGHAMAAADGAFSSPSEALTASINVSTWTKGIYTISVRALDAAGNWGPVATATLTVGLPSAIFADGFESGNFGAWSSTTGAGISVTAAAAISGTRGMQSVIAGNTPGYVTDNTPTNEPSYHARFYFNPNGTNTGTSQHDIFTGLNGTAATIFRVQYRRTGTGPFTYQIRAVDVHGNLVSTATNWYAITNAAHAIEIAWQAGTTATNGSLSLYIDGTLRQTLAGQANAPFTVKSVRLGPSGGLFAGMAGTEYYDAFVSTRYTVIGS